MQLQNQPVIEDTEERAELERRLNQQCITEKSFKDDGGRQARRLRRFIEPYLDSLSPDTIEAVEVAVSWCSDDTAHPETWISLENACISIRQQLLDIPYTATVTEQDVLDEEIEHCLLAAIEEVETARAL